MTQTGSQSLSFIRYRARVRPARALVLCLILTLRHRWWASCLFSRCLFTRCLFTRCLFAQTHKEAVFMEVKGRSSATRLVHVDWWETRCLCACCCSESVHQETDSHTLTHWSTDSAASDWLFKQTHSACHHSTANHIASG